MAMLHAIVSNDPGKRIVVAHMNHHAREESDMDERFVRQAADTLRQPFEAGHWKPARRAHFEADARHARYAWLENLAERYDAEAVMTAHTLNDQAETVLMRLARGTGPWGMGGIRPYRKLGSGKAFLVRPMTQVSRDDVLAYLKQRAIAFREDPTNADTVNQKRAWVRHVLIPQIEVHLNSRFREAIGKFTELQAEEQGGLDAQVMKTARNRGVARAEAGSLIISLAAYRSIRPGWLRRRLIRKFWIDLGLPQRGMTSKHWFQLDFRMRQTLSGRNAPFALPGRVMLSIDGDRAVISRAGTEPAITIVSGGGRAGANQPGFRNVVELPCPGRVTLEDGQEIQAEGLGRVPEIDKIREFAGNFAVLDAERVELPLVVRRSMPGDRFDPIGLDGHRQKVVDYLRIHGVKGASKAMVWLLEDRTGIVWVVGHGVSDRAKVRAETKSVWTIRIKPVHDTRGHSK